jgi:mannose-6-phosphate isomerase
MIAAQSHEVELDTQGETFHALTVIEGTANITSCDASLTLNCFESVVMPAACGAYRVQSLGNVRLLKASVESIQE